MRLVVVGVALCGLVAALAGCARVDPQEAAERAVIGGVAGTALGTAIGASIAINPAIGAAVGAESGAAIGAGIGVLTAQPLPDYRPIAVPAAAVIPSFYDTWPPGYHAPPIASQTPPPHPG